MSKSYLFITFLFLSLSKNLNSKIEPIKLKFMQKTFEKMNESNVMEILNDQNLIVEILLGTPIQKFNVHLRTDAYSTYLLGPQVKSSYPTFDTNSSSYRKIEEVDFIFSEDFKKADLSQENFVFGDSKIDNVSFSLVTEISALKINKTSGVIGLKFDSKTSQQLYNTSLINKLHSDKKISRNAFYFHFDERDTLNKDLKDNKNEFIFGAYPHQFNNEYSENNLTKINLKILEDSLILGMECNNIIYGNKNINITNSTRFNFNSGLIIAPLQFKEMIFDLFFNQKIQKKQCFFEELKTKNVYSYYYCNKTDEMKNDIKKMESLKFILKKENYTFEIKPEQLWYEYNNKLYYLILVPKGDETIDAEWRLGQPFLKNYDLIFDKDSKTVSLYTQKITPNAKPKDRTLIIVLLIISVIIVIGILVTIIIYLIKKLPRKKRANELNDDDYDYIQKESKNPLIV